MATYKRRGWSAKKINKTAGLQNNVTEKNPMCITTKGVIVGQHYSPLKFVI